MDLKRKSRFLSLLLRHKPETLNLTMDKEGWVDVEELLEKMKISMEELEEIVETNNKKRFGFDEDKTRIKAYQGHSLTDVEVRMKELPPPIPLYHGTGQKNVDKINKGGILKMNRNHVHLSDQVQTATDVGSRHGKPFVFIIDTKRMYEDGIKFYRSDNGVWLTEDIDPKYLMVAKNANYEK